MATSGFIRDVDGRKRPSRQRGMTVIGLLITAVAVGFVALLVMKVVPMYLNDQKISSVFEAMEEERGTERELRNSIERRLNINMVDHVSVNDFKFDSIASGTRITLQYEARANVVGNLYIVADFRHQVNVGR